MTDLEWARIRLRNLQKDLGVCPFCGHSVNIDASPNLSTLIIECYGPDCQVSMFIGVDVEHHRGVRAGFNQAAQRIIKRWNRREELADYEASVLG